ncbi:MAG: decaprenyl-phosphate phosphoribosyltransferase [Patescibacteria group bacterium]
MFNAIYQIIRTARPRQWLKNFSVFAAAVFAGQILDKDILFPTALAFVAFCMVSSGAYFVNDIIDAPKDRTHPIKKNRPIASGKLSKKLAWVVALGLIIGSLILSFSTVGTFFGFAVVAYIVLQFSYSVHFRNIIILDSLFVASGFVLRVFAGGFASNTSLSSWLVLTTVGLSLLMAFGKRRSEKTILKKHLGESSETETRETLRHYPDTLLDSMISMSSAFCILTYSLFTFQVSPRVVSESIKEVLPSILRNPKWMMLTIPIVIYGVARYLYVIYEKEDAESPERVLLSDKPLLTAVLLWGMAVSLIIYVLPS